MNAMRSYRRRTTEAPSPMVGTLPPLRNGDHLKQPEFHRRYLQMGEDKKAELIGGVVYMAAAVHRWHGVYHLRFATAIGLYMSGTKGVEGGDNMTAILDEDAEPQPDLMLRIETEYGGQTHYDSDNCLVGAPELVAEIAHSSVSIDLNKKRLDYQRAGVKEYVVLAIEEKKLHWFHFPTRRELRPDRKGIWKSREFPGLWVDGPALLERDTPALIAAVQRGLASPEHARFVAKLAKRKK